MIFFVDLILFFVLPFPFLINALFLMKFEKKSSSNILSFNNLLAYIGFNPITFTSLTLNL
jgi:hypothetical protein